MKAVYNSMNREGYENAFKNLHDLAKALHGLRLIGEKDVTWRGIEVVCEHIFPLMVPKNKCRIVIEYDPAAINIHAYREPMEKMKDLSDLPDNTDIWY